MAQDLDNGYIETVLLDDLEDGFLERVEVAGRQLAIGRVGNDVFAFDEQCTHQECSFVDGEIDASALSCPCHGAEFDPVTGAVLMGPATEPIGVHPTRIADGRVLVKRPE